MALRMLAYAWAVGFVPDVLTTDSCSARMSTGRVDPETLSLSIACNTPVGAAVQGAVPTGWVSVPLLPTSLAVFQDTTRRTWASAGAGANRKAARMTATVRRRRTVGTVRFSDTGCRFVLSPWRR